MRVNWVNDIPLPNEFDGLSASVVGGFPRDMFMGRNSNDVDIVITGVTVEDMLERGFNHIMSADERKPVFQDSLNREVAIARSETSTGDGHNDFEMDIVDPSLSHKEALELDLERRDLTINAIAVDIRTGEVQDPFNGLSDIENGVVRHVSPAFAEDPLRVLRAARYASRFGFVIDEETLELMASLSEKVEALPDDRFGQELVKVLKQAENPRRFFDILSDVGALESAFPEIASLQEVPAGPEKFHREGTAYEHTMCVLTHMHAIRGNDVVGLLAALSHDIGKGVTDDDVLPHHYSHEKVGKSLAEDMRKRLGLSRELRGTMSTSARVHGNVSDIQELNATTVLDVANQIENSPLSVEQVADLALSDNLGRIPQGDVNRELVVEHLRTAVNVLKDVTGQDALDSRGMNPENIGDTIPGERVGNMVRQDRAEEFRKRLN